MVLANPHFGAVNQPPTHCPDCLSTNARENSASRVFLSHRGMLFNSQKVLCALDSWEREFNVHLNHNV